MSDDRRAVHFYGPEAWWLVRHPVMTWRMLRQTRGKHWTYRLHMWQGVMILHDMGQP
jgi:hypothetical protein